MGKKFFEDNEYKKQLKEKLSLQTLEDSTICKTEPKK
jgi:hypothetical protein